MAGLSLHSFGVAFGEHVVLANVELALPERGVQLLLGPASAGKSTLLRTLAGLNFAQPSLRLCGDVVIDGGAWPDHVALPAMVTQHARLLIATVFENLIGASAVRGQLTPRDQRAWIAEFLARHGLTPLAARLDHEVASLPLGEQRVVAVARQLVSAPRVLLVDEPTAGLTDEESDGVIRLLRRAAEDALVVIVTHNQRHALALGGDAALFAGGHVIERAATHTFLTAPQTRAGKDYVRTGSCSVPSPASDVADLAPDSLPPTPLPPAFATPSTAPSPRHFRFTEPAVGGMPRPGYLDELDDDLSALRAMGIRTLVTLEETQTVAVDAIAAHGLRSIFFPIPDMGAPTVAAARAHIEMARADHLPVAYHCRAGLGRTGTLLAAHLIWAGLDIIDAIARVRDTIPRSIQSDVQVDFLKEFAASIRSKKPSLTRHTEPAHATNLRFNNVS